MRSIPVHFLLPLFALLLALAAGVYGQPIPACSDTVDWNSSDNDLSIAPRSQAPCQYQHVQVSSSPLLSENNSELDNEDDGGDDDYYDSAWELLVARTHSKTKLEKHGLHHLDGHDHKKGIRKVPNTHHFSHSSHFGTKTIKGSSVNKWARKAVTQVGGRKKVLNQNKLAQFDRKNARRMRHGYPKTGSGFAKHHIGDPVPAGHIAYHGILKPTRSEKKGKGMPNPEKGRQYPGPTRVIIHRHPNDSEWQIAVSHHDESKPITGKGQSHPFTEVKGTDPSAHS